MIDDDMLERIRDYAIHMDWDVAFGGKSRGNQHLIRVNKIATHLAGLKKARLNICIAGGWLHDIGLVRGNRHHCFTGAPLAREHLEGLGLDRAIIERIVHCIEAHDGEIVAETQEAKVVHDADTIDKMGPFGFIRHVWKMSLVEVMTPSQLRESVGKHIAERGSKIYFRESKAMVRPFNSVLNEFMEDDVTSERIIRIITENASRGVPSERVADTVLRDPSPSIAFRNTVKSQMLVDYL